MREQNETDEIELDLKVIFLELWSKKIWLLLVAVVFAVAAFAGTKCFITPKYDSVTKIYVQNREDIGEGTINYNDLQISNMLVQDYAGMINTRTVAEGVIEQLELEDMEIKQISQMISVGTSTTNRIITITVTDIDPVRARDIADCVRDIAGNRIREITGAVVQTVDPANLPINPSSPNAKRNAVLGALAGVFLLSAIFIIRFLLDDTIKTAEDVENYLGLSVLGIIPLSADENKTKKKAKKKQGGRK